MKLTDLPEPALVRHPDDLTFAEAFRIRGSIGVDVFNPDTASQQLLALIWYAGNSNGDLLSWADMVDTLKSADVVPYQAALAEEDARRQALEVEGDTEADAADEAAALAEQARAMTGDAEPEPVKPPDPTSGAAGIYGSPV